MHEGGIAMCNREEYPSYELEKMDKWLENFFLDPLTTYLDQTQFRIDLYETEKEWIVEALLSDYETSDITVFVEEKKLLIKAVKFPPPIEKNAEICLRNIVFPFTIINQKIVASFHSGILEVSISKIDQGLGRNHFITLP